MKMRKPTVKNKYNLIPSDINKFVLINLERLQQNPFWRNNVIKAYCLSGTTAQNASDEIYCAYNSYWIGFYDSDAPAFAGKIKGEMSSYGGMCHYKPKKFFDFSEIDCEIDLLIQEKFLKILNWLLDENICKFVK
jgi:hypothetical protein